MADKHKILKLCVDAVSAIFIFVFLACPWWIYLSGSNNSVPIISVIIFCVDAFPFLFGIFWLGMRYLKATDGTGRCSFILRWRLHHLVMILIVGIPFFLMKFDWK